MDIQRIVIEIDAELEKLRRIRAILEALLEPKSPVIAKPRKVRGNRVAATPAVKPEPRLIVLPPKERREYTRRIKPVTAEPKALAAPVSSRPVFVPKPTVTVSAPPKTARNESDLEAAMRRKLLGGAA